MKVDTPFPCSRIDEIVRDYLVGGLEPAESQLVESHLGTCPSCAGALRETEQMLQGLTALKEEVDPDVVEALVQEYRQVAVSEAGGSVVEMKTRQEKQPEGRIGSDPPGPGEAGRRAVAGWRLSWPQVLAAGLAAVSLALAFWVLQLRNRVEKLSAAAEADRAADHDRLASLEGQLGESRSELARSRSALRQVEEEVIRLSQPQASALTEYLYPPTYLRYSGAGPTVTVPRATESFQLIFVLDDSGGFPALEVSVLRSDGSPVWRSGGIPGDGSDHFATLFRRGFLPAGTYRAVLSGLAEDGRRSELARYRWQLVYE